MTPSRKGRRSGSPARTRPSADDEHVVVYYKRHRADDPTESEPGRAFLRNVCPPKVRATMVAVLGRMAQGEIVGAASQVGLLHVLARRSK